jgi:hypothetical protein
MIQLQESFIHFSPLGGAANIAVTKNSPIFSRLDALAFVYIFCIFLARRPAATYARAAKSQSFICTIQSFCFIRLFPIGFSSLSLLTLGQICSCCVTTD